MIVNCNAENWFREFLSYLEDNILLFASSRKYCIVSRGGFKGGKGPRGARQYYQNMFNTQLLVILQTAIIIF